MQLASRASRRSAWWSSSHGVGALRLLSVTIAVLGAGACGSSTPRASGGAPKPASNIITADEIAKVHVQTAYDAIQKLRPAMLRQRQVASAIGQGGVSLGAPARSGSAVTSGEVVVYADGTRLGPLENLRQIAASSVATLRYYSPSEAQLKWGSGHQGGAIEVITKR